MIIIRKTAPTDLDTLMPIFEEARKTIAALGIDQWQKGYPSRPVIEEDIAKGISYVVLKDGEICGTFVLLCDGEPTYDKIYDGAWRTEQDYIAIHRVAIAVKHRGQGIAESMMAFAVAFAAEKERPSLRIDTHYGNAVMRRMLEKNGFVPCGTIFLLNGDKRIAYEKLI